MRIGLGLGATAVLLLAGATAVKDATAYGETRALTLHHTHSGEDITVTFKRSGRYDEEGLKKLNWFLRDWRSQEPTTMNRQLFDIIWEVYRDVDGKLPVQIISSYRSPKTNAMLRRRSSGVARFSQHMQGNAMDFFIPGVPLEQIRAAGLRLQRGGVGFYPSSGSPFVHLDTGRIRHWPRMTRDQLVRVFPNGRTVHVPSDGSPLPGYQLAAADIEKRKNATDAGGIGPKGKTNMLASLLGGKSADDEDEATAAPAPAIKMAEVKPAAPKPADPRRADPRPAETPKTDAAPAVDKAAMDKTAAGKVAETPPLPKRRPEGTYQLAAVAQPTVAPKPARVAAQPAAPRPLTPADIINARGFWGEDAATTPAAEPQATASVPAQALAFAPPTLVGREQIIAASAPVPRLRPIPLERKAPAAATAQIDGLPAAATRTVAISASQDPWMRALIMSPSTHDSLHVTVFGDPDLTRLSSLMVKPRSALAMTFCDDPHQGLVTGRFTGSATAYLATVNFITRTAALR